LAFFGRVALAAFELVGHADHHDRDVVLFDQLFDPMEVGLEAFSLPDRERRGELSEIVAEREADPLGAGIDPQHDLGHL
jgi:hypothetical protein